MIGWGMRGRGVAAPAHTPIFLLGQVDQQVGPASQFSYAAQAQVVSGAPEVRAAEVATAPLEVGVWEHSVGTSTDVEADEVFVVLSGRATIEVSGGPTLKVGPGDVGILSVGSQTKWTVHETLRKVYVLSG